MSPRALRPALVAVGVVLFLVALTADRLRLGASPGIGWRQTVLALLGIVMAAVGLRRAPEQ